MNCQHCFMLLDKGNENTEFRFVNNGKLKEMKL